MTVEYSNPKTMDLRAMEVQVAMEKIDSATRRNHGYTMDGGFRNSVREAVQAVFDSGYIARAWEPAETTSEATGRVKVAGHIHERQEDTTEGWTEGLILPAHNHRWGTNGIECPACDDYAKKHADDQPDAVSELRGWWEQTAHDEVSQLTAKMIEYGGLSRATDLAEIGRGLINSGVKLPDQRVAPWVDNGASPQSADYQELGVYFYLLGKFARWTAAVAEGRPVSDDTLLDIGIYVRMAQRIRAVGGWPV